MTTSASQRAICILGMHRSGTSAITRIINLMGVDLGKNLMPPASENPEGFWENLDFVNINEKLLSHLEASWHEISSTFINHESWSEPEFLPFKAKIHDIITSNFSSMPLCGWKDPRTCLFFPLWSDALKEINIPTDVVIVWRNPISVAKSLSVRNGFTKEKGYQLWYAYTLSALFHSRNHNRIIINYDRLMDNWQGEIAKVTETLNLPWPNNTGFISDVEEFLNPTLRHSRVSYEQTMKEVPAYVAELYNLLTRTDKLEEDSFLKQIDSFYSLYSSLEQKTKRTTILPGHTNLTIYHTDNGQFSEEKSIYATIMPTVKYLHKFQLAADKSFYLRIDPLDRPGIIDEFHIKVMSENNDILLSGNLESMASNENHGKLQLLNCFFHKENQSFYLISNSYDPQIIIPKIDYSGVYHISISIRIIGFIPDALADSIKNFSIDSTTENIKDQLTEVTRNNSNLINHLQEQVNKLETSILQEQYNVNSKILELQDQSALQKKRIDSLTASLNQQISKNDTLHERIQQLESSLFWRLAKAFTNSNTDKK